MQEQPGARPSSPRPDAASWLVAHRGYPDAFPENSLIGMRAALEAGARFVEFDIQLSRDKVPMVIHDATLARVGNDVDNGKNEVADLPAEMLSTRTIGEPARFGPAFEAQRVPRMAEMLALLDEYPGVTAFIEIKRESLERFGTAAVVEPVLAEMRRAASRCIAISFDAAALEMVRRRSTESIGLVTTRYAEPARREAERLAPEYLFIQADGIGDDPSLFASGHWHWAVYVVDDPSGADELHRRGAALIETDRFPWLVSALRNNVKKAT